MFMKFSFFDANKYFKYILFEFDVLISSPVVSLRISKVAKLFSSAVNGRWIAHQNIHKKKWKGERQRKVQEDFSQFWGSSVLKGATTMKQSDGSHNR